MRPHGHTGDNFISRAKTITAPTGKLAFHEYLAWQINICSKSQREIALEIGYRNDNIITMFKKGATRLPLEKAAAMADALGVDKTHLIRMALSEYNPKLLEVVEETFGAQVSAYELEVLEILRDAAGGREPPLSDARITALKEAFAA
jgi:hypothetical protein